MLSTSMGKCYLFTIKSNLRAGSASEKAAPGHRSRLFTTIVSIKKVENVVSFSLKNIPLRR